MRKISVRAYVYAAVSTYTNQGTTYGVATLLNNVVKTNPDGVCQGMYFEIPSNNNPPTPISWAMEEYNTLNELIMEIRKIPAEGVSMSKEFDFRFDYPNRAWVKLEFDEPKEVGKIAEFSHLRPLTQTEIQQFLQSLHNYKINDILKM